MAFGVSSCTGKIGEPTPNEVIEPSNPQYCEVAGDEPGRVTMRRLNKNEYNNTVRDLVGIDLAAAG